MKKYATLLVGDDKYELLDYKGNIILSGKIPRTFYIYEHSFVFNILAESGWTVEFKMEINNWYMMAKEDV